MPRQKWHIEHADIIIMLFIFMIMFVLPLIFTKENGAIVWQSVFKIWQDRLLLIPLFLINHWLLVPAMVLKKKYTLYLVTIFIIIASVAVGYYVYDEKPWQESEARESTGPGVRPPRKPVPGRREIPRPQPVPPYADLLLFSLMIVSVDTGLSFTKHWHSVEEDKVRLEKENVVAQLGMLRNQISPHFLMNTLNNIYSLIDADKERSREAVMKLSKLMRYLLYENENGRVSLSKEFEFIRSYVDLIKLRYVDEVSVSLSIPENYVDYNIPVLIFVSYLENAFKFGTSYQNKSFIEAVFEIENNSNLIFTCRNSRNVFNEKTGNGGIGLRNSKQRLDLLYGSNYTLDISETEDSYQVKLKIPLG